MGTNSGQKSLFRPNFVRHGFHHAVVPDAFNTMMPREELIQRTLAALAKLPHEKAEEVADFAGFILMKFEEEALRKGIAELANGSESFTFLKEEEDLYTVADLKERYE